MLGFQHPEGQYLRSLRVFERARAQELCEREPEQSIFVRSALDRWRFYRKRDEILVFCDGDAQISGLCSLGLNISLFGFSDLGIGLLAEYLRKREFYPLALVGEAENVLALWEQVRYFFPSAEQVRERQWVMRYSGLDHDPDPCLPIAETKSLFRADPNREVRAQDESSWKILEQANLRLAGMKDFAIVFPAAVAMYCEELGVDPRECNGEYASHVRALISQKRTFICTQADLNGAEQVVFKADIGVLTDSAAQIQGVWTLPRLRGNGIASVAINAVARFLRCEYGLNICLYVNDFNFSAVRAYEKAGFEVCGTFATVMF